MHNLYSKFCVAKFAGYLIKFVALRMVKRNPSSSLSLSLSSVSPLINYVQHTGVRYTTGNNRRALYFSQLNWIQRVVRTQSNLQATLSW